MLYVVVIEAKTRVTVFGVFDSKEEAESWKELINGENTSRAWVFETKPNAILNADFMYYSK